MLSIASCSIKKRKVSKSSKKQRQQQKQFAAKLLLKNIRFVQTLPTIHTCKTKEELSKQVLDVHKAIADFYKNLPDEFFNSDAVPDGWSVKQNMKHVISTNFFFGFWIGLPSFIIKLKGTPNPKQRTIEEIDPTNRHGITSYGKYEKSPFTNPKKKEKLLKMIHFSAKKLNKHITRRSETELDALAGLFGGMSLRVFIHYLLKHNLHHTNVVRQRIEESV